MIPPRMVRQFPFQCTDRTPHRKLLLFFFFLFSNSWHRPQSSKLQTIICAVNNKPALTRFVFLVKELPGLALDQDSGIQQKALCGFCSSMPSVGFFFGLFLFLNTDHQFYSRAYPFTFVYCMQEYRVSLEREMKPVCSARCAAPTPCRLRVSACAHISLF